MAQSYAVAQQKANPSLSPEATRQKLKKACYINNWLCISVKRMQSPFKVSFISE